MNGFSAPMLKKRFKMDFDKKVRVIAFYLPQFHPIPENDIWWGKGFTEWTNVAKAKPLFKGHYQPKIPADLGFYDLRLPETRQAQADLAVEYGVEGFCYYHYWFGGKRILEKPFEEVLKSGKPKLPFCLCWANHSWNSIWQGCPDRILVEQIYPGIEDHKAHFSYLLNAFSDERYITVDGKPIFFIYKPNDLPDIKRVVDLWRKLAHKAGLKGLHLVGISHFQPGWDPRDYDLDACMMQKLPIIKKRISKKYFDAKFKSLFNKMDLSIYEYKEMENFLLRDNAPEFLDYPCVLPNWDNTPRAGWNGLVFHESSPLLFKKILINAINKVLHHSEENKIVMLKAWNEWAEGNYVEPDLKFGRGYLEVIRELIFPKGNLK